MTRASRLGTEEKLTATLELLAERMSHAEVCRKHGISAALGYRLKDRAVRMIREGIERPDAGDRDLVRELRSRIEQLERLAGEQALIIRNLSRGKADGQLR